MAITKELKTEIVEKYRLADTDTGSPEVQVALLTARINDLTEHMKVHKKDFASRQGLVKMVNLRKKLLRYVERKSSERYRSLIQRLGLRK